jgi:hypothetical protein
MELVLGQLVRRGEKAVGEILLAVDCRARFGKGMATPRGLASEPSSPIKYSPIAPSNRKTTRTKHPVEGLQGDRSE